MQILYPASEVRQTQIAIRRRSLPEACPHKTPQYMMSNPVQSSLLSPPLVKSGALRNGEVHLCLFVCLSPKTRTQNDQNSAADRRTSVKLRTGKQKNGMTNRDHVTQIQNFEN